MFVAGLLPAFVCHSINALANVLYKMQKQVVRLQINFNFLTQG